MNKFFSQEQHSFIICLSRWATLPLFSTNLSKWNFNVFVEVLRQKVRKSEHEVRLDRVSET